MLWLLAEDEAGLLLEVLTWLVDKLLENPLPWLLLEVLTWLVDKLLETVVEWLLDGLFEVPVVEWPLLVLVLDTVVFTLDALLD